MSNNKTVRGYPFVAWVNPDHRPLLIDPVNFLKNVFGPGYHSSLHNILTTGFYKSAGYMYNLKPFMKRYLYKQYDSWYEVYAPNKTLLRKTISGKIVRIIELKP